MAISSIAIIVLPNLVLSNSQGVIVRAAVAIELSQTMPRVRRRQAADLGRRPLGSSVVEEFTSFFSGWGMLAHQGVARR